MSQTINRGLLKKEFHRRAAKRAERTQRYIFCFLILGAVNPCGAAEVARSWPVMGTYAEVQIDSQRPLPEIESAIESVRMVFNRVDRTMSVYKPQSDIVRVNSAAGQAPVTVDPWLADVTRKGKCAAGVTNGAFSLNVLEPGVRLGLKPNLTLLAGRRWDDRYIHVSWWRPRIFLEKEGMGLDVGGIAKGYALDRAAQAVRRLGFRRFLMTLGRSIYAGMPPEGSKGWAILMEGETEPLRVAMISIAVSRQNSAGHIVDPRTGVPVRAGGQVAVAARRAWIADMASTALIVNPSLEPILKTAYPDIFWVRVSYIDL